MAKDRRGVPKGTVHNPKGVNQYSAGKGTGQKDTRIQLLVSTDEKNRLKEVARAKGMSLSSWIVELALEAAQT